jgi:uncharacterized membrane protein (TIGR02234 family)
MPARRELLVALGACLLGAVLALAASAPTWVRIAVPRARPLADAVVAVSGRDLAPLVPALGLVGLAAVVGLVGTRGRGRSALGAVLAGCGIAVVLAAGPHLAALSPPAAAVLVTGHGPLPGRDLTQPVEPRAEPVWPALAVVGGLLLAAAGTVSVVRGRRWPAMSARYDPPTAPAASSTAPIAGPTAAPTGANAVPTQQVSSAPPADPAPPASSAGPEGTARLAPQRLWDALDRGDDPTA